MDTIDSSTNKISSETKRYFKVILAPYTIDLLLNIDDLLNYEKEIIKKIASYFKNRNVNIFYLCGHNLSNFSIYYVDLETPLLFYLLTTNIISHLDFKNFKSISSQIKSNLMKYYCQNLDIQFLLLKQSNNEISFTSFKLEDQSVTNQKDLSEIKLQNGRKRHPVGQISSINKLNRLTGREWIKFSKSWFIHRPPSRNKEEILHPAKFPETMIREFITFFTKPGEVVLDPFLGTGSTLVAAKQCNRSGYGFELSKAYTEISENRLFSINDLSYPPIYQTQKKGFWNVLNIDSRQVYDYWVRNELKPVDFCITSPPYWNQLKRDEIRQKERKEIGLDTQYSENLLDIGNIPEYFEFITVQKDIFDQVHQILKFKGYLVIITNNVFTNGKLYPLAYETAQSLIQGEKFNWILKDEKIWLQDDKSLIAFGVNNAWVANRCHQFCLIFRKDDINSK